ncbi:hypothetical protein Pmani_018695 [Petrolisthes manimaculis]|uniref:Transmembrane protein 245 n=1 Tax=Petrolisthes manimaculis TaxID=1843537 RepID=A0AAE1PKI5_9EUCA|nr:hypothetical protein Pmani_018695 [Petrolisthes manimaculis]
MSVYGEGSRSPLEQVWRQFVPQGHDQALRNAFYNVAAVVFVAGVGAAAWSVYIIFQPFVQPLLWAVLCGSVLHPFKHRITSWTRAWFGEIQNSHSLLCVSVALLPFTVLDTASERIGRFVVTHVRSVVMVTVILPLLYIVIYHTPPALTALASTLVNTLLAIITALVSAVTWNCYLSGAVVVVYVGTVCGGWSDHTASILTRLSVPVWLVAAAALSGLWPGGSVAIFLVLASLMVAGLGVEVADLHAQRKLTQGGDASLLESARVVCLGSDASHTYLPAASVQEAGEIEGKTSLSPVEEEEEEEVEEEKERRGKKAEQGVERNEEEKQEATVEQNQAKEPSPITETPRPRILLTAPPGQPSAPLQAPSTQPKPCKDTEENGSNIYLKGVVVGCVLVEFWQHNYLLPLLPVAMLYYFIKKIAWHTLAYRAVSGAVKSVSETASCFLALRSPALLPPPIRGLAKLLVRSDRQLVVILAAAVDSLITLLLILAVICFAVTASIFLAVQIQGESMSLVALGGQVVNSTLANNPQVLQLLPAGLGDLLTSALDEGYIYGRQWIATMVRDILGETDEVKAAQLEQQVVEVWDRVYQAWVVAHPPSPGPQVTSEAVQLSFDSLVDGLRKTPGVVSISFVTEVVRENLGTVMSVLESLWSLVLGNLSLAISTLTAAASLLLGGSLSILNALISVIIFMSSLFYVLSASSSVYKPVSTMANLAPAQMNHLGKAVEDAVNGVFIASFKMGAFYGLWTWFLHSLFSTNVVYIPAVLGAILGAVPLVGTYWAGVLGAVELWWHRGSPAQAALLMGAQILPMSCVDTAIYADIKGGSHPYLTGLAVAGGVFYWGAQGAILGPLLLCILKVATNMYSTLIQSPATDLRRFKLRRNPTIN